jgi:hypothetical protein
MGQGRTPAPTDWTTRDIAGGVGIKFDVIRLIDLDHDGDLDVITSEEREHGGGLGAIWYENPSRSASSAGFARKPVGDAR